VQLATTSLTQVEGSARSALAELRQLLETLRTSPDADAAPQPSLSLDAIETLVTNAAAAGLPTTLTTVGAPCEVPDLVQVNLVRIAQEALTNARRHGGHDATADVRLRFEADAVELEVANTGRVAASVTPGLGMVGMRERVTVSGGTLELIPRTGGGFIVRARVPLPRSEETP
jgi:signal transduction histidine kinase